MEGSASQAGFYYQNNVAALKIIDCLFFNSDINFIELENYSKGHHIDDIIVYKKDKIDYYQVKWSNDGETVYSLYNLLNAEEGKKSLFKQLSEGYKSVLKNKIDFSITLYTTKKEGSERRPSKGINHSLSEIRRKIFEPLKKTSLNYESIDDYSKYKDTLEIIKNECELDSDSFNDFIKKLEFLFSQESTEQIQNEIRFKLDKLGIEDNLLEKLLDGIVNWSITGEKITKSTVLNVLGISSRFEDKLSHYFKVVDDKHYVPNKSLLSKLDIALNELDGGYIFIEGLPGIGKSTALTKFKKSNPDVTLAYYCFIPDSLNNFGELRHKSHYFLKSLCISIEKQFPDVDLPNKYSEKYDEKLVSYIDKLSTIENKVVFIIDGLDHVHRNLTNNEDSLLNQIKGDLPRGIFFILSSQYKKVLSQSVAKQIDSDPRRHIVVPRFTQNEIEEYLAKKDIYVPDHLDNIEKISKGIPLYLHYISELLIKSEQRNYEDVISKLPDLIDGEINSYHEYLFQRIKDDEFIKWIFAVFAYRKENSTPETIHQILQLAGEDRPITDIINVIQSFSHLFRQIESKSFTIFHNSFREFIISKTADLKEKFNETLVLYYEKNPNSDDAYRNYFSHLFDIGNYNKITTSTTLEWIKTAWSNYRTLNEIQNNLRIALNASIELASLSEFIRILFIKAQFDRLSWNIENSEIDFSILLLNVGETANSLRSIWDGDFVLTNKTYFSHYLIKYFEKKSTLLPHNIIEQGLSKSLDKGNSDQITTIYKAQALTSNNVVELFNEIDEIKWVKSNEHRVDYHKENYSEKENTKTNLKIKAKIIDTLLSCKKTKELLILVEELRKDEKLLNKALFALVKLFLPYEKRTGVNYIQQIDFNLLPDKAYFKIISFCSDYLSKDEILSLFPKRDISIPNLHEKVVQNEGVNYHINRDILNLFDLLKPIWIFQPEIINTLLLRVTSLPQIPKAFYNSILFLSELWKQCKENEPSESEKKELIKKAIGELYIQHEPDYRRMHRGLFDMDNDGYFIALSIKSLYSNIFIVAQNCLTNNSIIEIIDYWFELESGNNGYRHYNIALAIAKELNNKKDKNLDDVIYRLIAYSEKLARNEEETATLIEYIAAIAECYGECGFKADFKRNYNQLIELAFGLDYKKDYQSSYITSALELIHKSEPDKTLSRLYVILEIQNKLSGVGRSRMNHICLSDLIAFTIKYYPQLAFILFEYDEKYLGREEAMGRILQPLIQVATSDELLLIFGIVKTFPRWSSVNNEWDNHFLKLGQYALDRAIILKDNVLINKIVETLKYYSIIETENIDILKSISQPLINGGFNIDEFSLPNPEKVEAESKPKKSISRDERFSETRETLSTDELISLFEKDYSGFNLYLQNQFKICLKNRRNSTLRNEYHRSKKTFEKFLDGIEDKQWSFDKHISFSFIRQYIEFKKSITEHKSSSILKYSEVEKYFNGFIEKSASLFPDNSLKSFVHGEFDTKSWIDNILKFVNDHRAFVFEKVIDEKILIELVQFVSVTYYEQLIDFIKKYPFEKSKSTAYLIIANRIINFEPQKAKEILSIVADIGDENLLFSRDSDNNKLDIDIAETILKIDLDFGKKFLLKSYLNHKGGYSDSIITSIERLLKYSHFFNDELATRVYFDSNLLYNKELAKGLPPKTNRYEFIKNHKENLTTSNSIFKHLIWLLDYPVIKVREMTMKSIYELILFKVEFLEDIFEYGIDNGTENQIEYCLIILQAVSVTNPNLLKTYKKKLITLSSKKHFNILESVKEILLNIWKVENDFLTQTEKSLLDNLNSKSPIIFNNTVFNTKEGKNFIYSEYQGELLYKLSSNEDDITEFHQDVYSKLIQSGWDGYNAEKDSAIHCNYNINTNFDTIEIFTPYCDSTQDFINEVLYSKIKRGCFEQEFIEKIKFQLRLYDPSKLIYPINTRPSYINWLPLNTAIKDFESLIASEKFKFDFVNREDEFITIAEFGNQRNGGAFDDNMQTCYFDIYAFMKKKGFNDSILDTYNERGISPRIQDENLFTYDLPIRGYSSSSFPIKEIKPLIQITHNNFRAESDLTFASLLYDVFDDFNIQRKNLLEIMTADFDFPIKAERWQNAYTSSGRRRYKPTSEGFTLRMSKKYLVEYLEQNNMELCYEINLRYSDSTSRPESYMTWHSLAERFEADIGK